MSEQHWKPARSTFDWRKEVYNTADCPKCGEPIGRRCVGMNKQRRKSQHQERINAAKMWTGAIRSVR